MMGRPSYLSEFVTFLDDGVMTTISNAVQLRSQ